MLSKTTKEAAVAIGEFYLAKHNGDHNKACEELLNVRIRELIVLRDFIIIKTERPGMLIGKRGENIDELQKHLGKAIHIVEDEDELEGYLLPQEPIQDDYYYPEEEPDDFGPPSQWPEPIY